MFIVFLLLTIIFTLFLIAGFVWGLIVRGKTTKGGGREVGAELMAENMGGGTLGPGKTPLTRRTWFRGKGVEVDREAEYSYAEIKKMLEDRRFLAALPPLLMMAGIIGLTFLLGLTLLTRAATLVPGLVLLAFSAYAAYLILAGFIKDEN